MSTPLEHYGLIGNMRGAALVSVDGSIDWLCVPRFDSDACFAALLGTEEHGRWRIHPASGIRRSSHAYRESSLVLETRFECDGGVARVIDFMPTETDRDEVVRIVEGVEGTVPMLLELAPRFGFGADRPFVRGTPRAIELVAGPDGLTLWSSVPCEIDDATVRASFEVSAGQQRAFTLAWRPSHRPAAPPLAPEFVLASTDRFWRDWAARCTYRGRWRDAVVRSLITLKALTYAPTGGIVAAPTTSLPEEIGGSRNWDYRFCWLRDASITLAALLRTGYVEEATAWRDWVVRAVLGDPSRLSIMYGIAGERRLTEVELPWLPGYEGSRPVRIGNAASEQLQLDVYGEMMACVYLAHSRGMPPAPWARLAAHELVEFAASHWSDPDDGIWEVRGGRRHFTYSKVMAWVALERAIRLAREVGDAEAPIARWRAARDAVRSDVLERGFDAAKGAFTQAYGEPGLDASVLLMPHVGFLRADDPRMVSTVRAVERELVEGGYVKRYQAVGGVDGLAGDEGAFLACTFWLADNYVMAGRVREAEEVFERLVALRNDLGLLSEEVEPRTGRQIGNFPQAFTHVALVATAVRLEDASARAEAGATSPTPAHAP